MIKRKFIFKHCRGFIGYTQKDMADKLGISLTQYQRYERYEVDMPFPIADKFRRVVGMEFDEIYMTKEELE